MLESCFPSQICMVRCSQADNPKVGGGKKVKKHLHNVLKKCAWNEREREREREGGEGVGESL